MEFCDSEPTVEKIFVVGGTEVYRTAMNDKRCNRIYYTAIKRQFECDTWYPLDELEQFGAVSIQKSSSVKLDDGSEVEFDFMVMDRS